MKEIVEFLKNIESRAFEVYSSVADYFSNHVELSEFLSELAGDEALHFNLMDKAYDLLKGMDNEVREHIVLDKETKSRIIKPLNDCYNLQQRDSLSKKILLENIVKAEFSEWNHIFLYVISRLKEDSSVFSFAAAKIQAHEEKIERFLAAQGDTAYLLDEIRKTPKLWDKNVLIVDDEVALLDLLKAVLSNEFTVETAEDGLTAIKMIEKSYYNAVISDVDMPVMDGTQLFKEILKSHPKQAEVFAFATGNITNERLFYAKDNDIVLFEKPYTFDQIREFIHRCVEK